MTKAEIIKAILTFDDDQFIYIGLRSADFPEGLRVFIQGVEAKEPWTAGPKPMIELVADAHNRVVKKKLQVEISEVYNQP